MASMEIQVPKAWLPSALIAFAILCHSIAMGKCPPDDPNDAVDFVFIPEENYDRNYSSISSIDKRPLGFEKATWHYNQQDESNPCIRVSGASDRRIEIMFETHPTSRLCVKEKTSSAECSDAGTGRGYTCKRAPSDVMYFEFYCDQGEEYDVRFWYRFVLGVLPEDDPEGYWCDGRGSGDYPASLLRLPVDFPMNNPTTPSPDAGMAIQPNYGLVAVFASVLLLLTQAVVAGTF